MSPAAWSLAKLFREQISGLKQREQLGGIRDVRVTSELFDVDAVGPDFAIASTGSAWPSRTQRRGAFALAPRTFATATIDTPGCTAAAMPPPSAH